VGAVSQKRFSPKLVLFFRSLNIHSGKFKHLKYFENVKFAGTNNIESILVIKANVVNLVIGDLVLKVKPVLILTVLKVKLDCKYIQNMSESIESIP